LSLDAVQPSVIDVVDDADTDTPVGTEGATVSGHALVAACNVDTPDTFPAASNASTPTVYDVPHASPLNLYDVETVDVTFAPFKYTS
jgi:hypothetical protein